MKDLKKLKLPRWVRKRVAHKEEDNDISAFVVGVMALYCVFVIAYFAYAPFGSKYLGYQVIITCTLLVIIAYVSCWFVRQFTMLRSYRQEAII